eukprot:7755653-Alexandrium_andersonii.AAC.1
MLTDRTALHLVRPLSDCETTTIPNKYIEGVHTNTNTMLAHRINAVQRIRSIASRLRSPAQLSQTRGLALIFRRSIMRITTLSL